MSVRDRSRKAEKLLEEEEGGDKEGMIAFYVILNDYDQPPGPDGKHPPIKQYQGHVSKEQAEKWVTGGYAHWNPEDHNQIHQRIILPPFNPPHKPE